jgi:hypothetical protein
MSKLEEVYFSKEIDRLSVEEQFALGCYLVDLTVQNMRPLPPNVADRLWKKIYQCESLISQASAGNGGDLARSAELLSESLEMIGPYRHDVYEGMDLEEENKLND